MKGTHLKLEALKKLELRLRSSIEHVFASEKEFNSFVENNKETFIELTRIKNEIKAIEWELLTDEEKKNHQQYLNDLKEKFKEE
jgi:hypothetical protein